MNDWEHCHLCCSFAWERKQVGGQDSDGGQKGRERVIGCGGERESANYGEKEKEKGH